MDKHIEANAELAADLLRHMADNEIDSDYFAVVTDSPNCGREVQSEHKVTDAALMAAGIIDALLAKLEAAEKEISDWRSIAEAAAQDDADWHNLADSKNEVISHLASGIIQLKERAAAAEARLLVPVEFPDSDIGIVSHMAHWYSQGECEAWVAGVEFSKKQIIKAGYPVEESNAAILAPAPAGVVMRPPFEKPLERCAAARDGECNHKECPQLRDNEPMATGRHCPIDDWDD